MERIILIKGPRRTGKTTLLYQMIDYLLKKRKISPKSILYLSFDDIEVREALPRILKIYEEVSGKTIPEQKQVYFFLDEVHFLDNWSLYLKRYFDKKMPIKFIVSGSSASLVKKGAESLAGRTVEEKILPFTFYEFLEYRLGDKKIINTLKTWKAKFSFFSLPDITPLIPYQQKIVILFQEYLLRGGFPHLFGVQELIIWKKLLREDVIEKIIYRDLVEQFRVKKPYLLEKLFFYLTLQSSDIFNVLSISNSLKLSREYVEKYVHYLEESFLIFRLKKYSPSIEKRLRSNKKLHLMDSGMIRAFGTGDESRLIESGVGRHLFPYNLYYWREKYEVDFVLELRTTLPPIEVKYQSEISKGEIKGILQFMKRFKTQKGIIITRDLLQHRRIDNKTILFLPAWLFLLALS